MKATTLLCLVVCIPIFTNAQFNRTYTIPNYELGGRAVAIDEQNNEIYFGASAMQTGSVPITTTDFVLTKTDLGGNVQASIILNMPYEKYRLMDMNDGVLLAAYSNGDAGLELHLIAYNSSLVRQWAERIPLQYVYATIQGFASYYEIDIEKIVKEEGDEFYILCQSESHVSGYENSDFAFSVVKITQSGSLVWHKSYADVNRVADPIPSIGDLASGITSRPENEGLHLAITGTRRQVSIGFANYLFYMLIDQDGNIVSPYRRVQTAEHFPFRPDIVWDGQDYVTTYAETNATFNPVSNQASGIGVFKLSTSLGLSGGKYYWQYCENYGLSITNKTADGGGGYYVHAYVSGAPGPDCTAIANGFMLTPGMLTLNNDLTLNSFARYDIWRAAYTSGWHVTGGKDENYFLTNILSSAGDPTSPYGFNSVRMIKTDALLNVCGAKYPEIYDLDFSPEPMDFEYYDVLHDVVYDLDFGETPVDPEVDNCKDASDPDYYKQGVSEPANDKTIFAVEVVPNHLRAGERLEYRIYSAEEGEVEIMQTDLLGRMVNWEQIRVVQGENRFYRNSSMPPGLNVIYFRVKGETKAKLKLVCE